MWVETVDMTLWGRPYNYRQKTGPGEADFGEAGDEAQSIWLQSPWSSLKSESLLKRVWRWKEGRNPTHSAPALVTQGPALGLNCPGLVISTLCTEGLQLLYLHWGHRAANGAKTTSRPFPQRHKPALQGPGPQVSRATSDTRPTENDNSPMTLGSSPEVPACSVKELVPTRMPGERLPNRPCSWILMHWLLTFMEHAVHLSVLLPWQCCWSPSLNASLSRKQSSSKKRAASSRIRERAFPLFT